MSNPIISALDAQKQLSHFEYVTAREIAAKMSRSGVGYCSFKHIATKLHMSIRTAIRYVNKLLTRGLFTRQHTHTALGYGWNRYTYIGPRLQDRSRPATAHSDRQTYQLPNTGREVNKSLSLGKEIAHLRSLIDDLTPGSVMCTIFAEQLADLEALKRGYKELATCHPSSSMSATSP